MQVDFASLAVTLVSSFLLPYIKIGAEKLTEGLGENIGKAAAEHTTGIAKRVWERVSGLFESQKEHTALELFKENPEELTGLIEKMLRQKLEASPSLAEELSGMINAPGPDGTSSGAQIMHAGIAGILDASRANFRGAHGITLAGVIVGEPPPPPQKPEKDA
jgi:hypothetical protein